MTVGETILAILLSNAVFVGIAGWLIRLVLETRIKEAVKNEYDKSFHNYQEHWKIKRDACLAAMEVVDASFSHATWENLDPKIPRGFQTTSTTKAREVWNRLAVACNSEKVLIAYFKCICGDGDGKNRTAPLINELRLAIREELGLKQIPLSNAHCFITSVENDPELMTLAERDEEETKKRRARFANKKP